ncbi:hypothetical protein D9M68_648660 [compost metagenome]
MAGAHGDALLGEQVRQVGVVHAVDAEAGQGQLGFAKQAYAVPRAESRQQLGMEGRLMAGDGGGVEAGQIVQRRAQADHRGDGRGAGLEAERGAVEVRRLVGGGVDHLTTELPMFQACQGLAAAVEHADAVRAVELVAGKGVEVAAQGLHIMAAMHRALGAVHHRQRAPGPGQRQQLGQRLPAAEYVGQLAHGEQPRARADQPAGLFQVDQAAIVERQHHQFQLPAQGQLLPWQQVGVVFQGADDDLVTGLEQVLQAVGEQVDGFGGAAGEEDFRWAGGIQPVRRLGAAAFEGAGGALAGQVLGAVHIGRTAGVVAEQGVQHGLGLLRGCGTVEVGLSLGREGRKGREVGAPGGYERHGVVRCDLSLKAEGWRLNERGALSSSL